jgi:hypothetical protein
MLAATRGQALAFPALTFALPAPLTGCTGARPFLAEVWNRPLRHESQPGRAANPATIHPGVVLAPVTLAEFQGLAVLTPDRAKMRRPFESRRGQNSDGHRSDLRTGLSFGCLPVATHTGNLAPPLRGQFLLTQLREQLRRGVLLFGHTGTLSFKIMLAQAEFLRYADFQWQAKSGRERFSSRESRSEIPGISNSSSGSRARRVSGRGESIPATLAHMGYQRSHRIFPVFRSVDVAMRFLMPTHGDSRPGDD